MVPPSFISCQPNPTQPNTRTPTHAVEEELGEAELYDEDADAADEKWVNKHWRKETTQAGKKAGPQTDAVLNCPCCFTTLCMDCQQ